MAIRDNNMAEIRPAHLEDWLDGLPYADFARSTEMLRQALIQTNRTTIKAATRVELLSRYYRPYNYLLTTHIKQVDQPGLRTLDAVVKRIEAIKQIAIEMARSAALARTELLRKQGGFLYGRPPPALLLLSAKLLSHVIALNYHRYAPVPSAVWQELHQTYELAEQLACTTKNVSHDPAISPDTVAAVYGQTIGTALTDPYRLSFGSVWEIYDQLDDWVSGVSIGPFIQVDNPAGYFVVDLRSDHEPIAYAKFVRDSLTIHHRLINCAGLQRLVEQNLQTLQRAQPSAASCLSRSRSIPLLRYLTRAWGLPPKRYFPRREREGEVELAYGFDSAHYHLNGVGKIKVTATSAIPRSTSGTDHYVPRSSPDYVLERWNLINEGSGGYAIFVHEKPQANIRIGEIVALKDDHKPAEEWILGVVRWLMIHQERGYKLGIQAIARDAQPVSIKLIGNSDTEPQRGFLQIALANSTELKLIAPKGTLAKQQSLKIDVAGNSWQIKTGDLLDSTTSYDQFVCNR